MKVSSKKTHSKATRGEVNCEAELGRGCQREGSSSSYHFLNVFSLLFSMVQKRIRTNDLPFEMQWTNDYIGMTPPAYT